MNDAINNDSFLIKYAAAPRKECKTRTLTLTLFDSIEQVIQAEGKPSTAPVEILEVHVKRAGFYRRKFEIEKVEALPLPAGNPDDDIDF